MARLVAAEIGQKQKHRAFKGKRTAETPNQDPIHDSLRTAKGRKKSEKLMKGGYKPRGTWGWFRGGKGRGKIVKRWRKKFEMMGAQFRGRRERMLQWTIWRRRVRGWERQFI